MTPPSPPPPQSGPPGRVPTHLQMSELQPLFPDPVLPSYSLPPFSRFLHSASSNALASSALSYLAIVTAAFEPPRVNCTIAAMVDLPYALDAETYVFSSSRPPPIPATPDHAISSPLKASELQVLRAQYEKEGDMVGVQTKFNYAWGLVKSDSRNDQQLGVRLLSEIFRVSPERRRECLFYLALGNYKLGNYGEARRYNDLLLEKEPANLQASNLRQLVDDKVAKEGLMGVAIISGVAVAAGVVGAFLVRNVKRR
ncbi:mitochondria fission 1 protein [Colletotrichum lupini]|uniref:Mitochondrial fission 1 protein n=1 Tax=Colletotrichum lupini TaxID=145971 RepID=A0A9Q8SHC3_9PEZI|nr:mitochondria fission 1 protein [Colletotrichum lupini]UQC76502.1 mitochondria fission 1 protein [Colletotrichum lupini]